MAAVTYDKHRRTFDCPATLTDRQVLAFCLAGFCILDGVIGEDANQRTCAYIHGELAPIRAGFPPG